MERMPKCVVEKEFERKRAHDVIQILEQKAYSLEVCEWACRAFVGIAGIAMNTQNTESMADFLDDGGCEALVNIMHKYSAISNTIASNGSLCISILAWSLRDLKEFLGDLGACEIVVFATSMHIGDPEVSEYGSAAIGLLAKNNISNSFRLSQSGACDVISQVGNFGFNIRHEKCTEVATNVCIAFALLSEAANAQRLLECGAPQLVPELMKFHFKDKAFAAAAMKAVCGFASLNVKLREELGRTGVCDSIMEIIRMHEDSLTITLDCCEAILHLSLSPNNTARLGNAGACQAVVTALKIKLMEYDFGAEICSGAMLNLATYGMSATDNRNYLFEAGAVETLRAAQLSTKASYRARENILKLLELLGAEHTPGTATGANMVTGSGSGVLNRHKSIVVHGSEMVGDTIPLAVEIREVEYDSFSDLTKLDKDSQDGADDLTDRVSPFSNNGILEI